MRHEDLAVPVLPLAELLAREVHHEPVQPLGSLRISSDREKFIVFALFQELYWLTNLLGASGSIMARV